MKRHKWGTPDARGDQRCEVCGLERTQVANGRGRGTHWEYWHTTNRVIARTGKLARDLRTYARDCKPLDLYPPARGWEGI